MLIATIRPAVVLFAAMTVVTGIVYPLVVTAGAKIAFADKAAGSLIEKDGKIIGSKLIGQNFTSPEYFWGRPSATGPYPYNAAASSGSNQGPLNPALVDAVKGRIDTLHAMDPDNKLPIPVDLVTASASGLDPHISVAAANYQAARIAKIRNVDINLVQAAIANHTEGGMMGLLGEPRVNVLKLNLALDALAQSK
jgi:potassium-transporting ATPase KdpC subunit